MTIPKKCGIKRIDDLIDGVPGTEPIDENTTDKDAIGAVQDLLVGFNLFPDLLGLRNKDHRGKFDKLVKDYVGSRRKKWGIEPKDKVIVDRAFLLKLLELSQPESSTERNPIASRIYLTRILGLDFTPFLRCVWLTAIQETDGRFARASKRGQDKAGLSYGILQWTHRSKNLSRIMQRYLPHRPLLRQCFGGEANVQKMLEHAGKGDDALNPDGTSKDPALEFLDEPWRGRFILAGRKKVFQEAQVTLALDDFRENYRRFNEHATTPPLIVSERGIAFTLDLINQRGFKGAIIDNHDVVHGQAGTEKQLLELMRDNAPMPERRNFFLTTDQLSDGPFVP